MAHDCVGVIGRDERCDLKREKLLRRVCVSNFLRMEVFLVMKNIIKCNGASGAFLFLGSWGTQRLANAVTRQQFGSWDGEVWMIPLTVSKGGWGGIGKGWARPNCLPGRYWQMSGVIEDWGSMKGAARRVGRELSRCRTLSSPDTPWGVSSLAQLTRVIGKDALFKKKKL